MRQLYSIAIVLLVFFGSVGIPLYQHKCLHDDITIHTLFTGSDHCEVMQEEEQPNAPDCCASKVKKQEVKEDHCCTEDVTRLALAFNFFENWQLQTAMIPQAELKIAQHLPYSTEFPAEKQVMLCVSDTDPPPLSGRDRLPVICIWRL